MRIFTVSCVEPFYQPLEHTLAHISRRTSSVVGELMCRILKLPEQFLPDALILFTGAFHRLSRKYGSFAYRLMNLDTGSSLSQLHMVAKSIGLYAHTTWSKADDLIQEELNLNCVGEYPTAIVEISRKPCKRSWSALLLRLRSKRTLVPPRSWKPASLFANMDVQEVTTQLIAESRILEFEPLPRARPIPRELLSERCPPSVAVRLPKPANNALSLGDVLANRRSIREFSQRPVDAGAVGTALCYARAADVADWSDEHRCRLALTYLVIARQIVGVEPGVYRYDDGIHGLCKVGSALSHEEMIDLIVQDEFANAPVLVWITGNLAAACARDGARGHRQLLVRAGAAGHRLWMAALGLGLSGAVVAGLVPGAARRVLGMDGYNVASLFAFAGGYGVRGLQSQAVSKPIIPK